MSQSSSVCTRPSLAWACHRPPALLVSRGTRKYARRKEASYLVFVLILVILITVLIVLVLVIFIFEVVLVEVIHALLELQSLSSEPVDGARDELLLDVFTQLIVKFQLSLNVVVDFIVIILRRGCWVEEVEE